MQMKEELRQMEGKTSWYEEQIRESAGRYEKLYCRISKEDAASPEFQASRTKWSRIYEERTVDRIRRRSRHFWPDAFQKVLYKTDYTLGHALYLAGRTEYVMSRLQASMEEMTGGGVCDEDTENYPGSNSPDVFHPRTDTFR